MTHNPIEMLQADHAEIKRQIAGLDALFANGDADPAAVADAVHILLHTLDLHERREEQVLFPAVPQVGPIQLVLQEHARLKGLLDKTREALHAVRDTPGAESQAALRLATQEMGYCLSGHIMKEDQIAFRMAEGVLSPEQLAEIGAKMADLS
ncbi:MAG: hemerythrin domain-containing protein [Nitrospirota bacterium]|nr:hemerythrin domain-containing protein [Nitrospirota bacterium]